MKLAIVGVGSLGTIIGGFISAGGHNIELIDTNEAHVSALNNDGAKISGFMQKTIPVSAKRPTEIDSEYDIVFLLTKQVYTKKALSALLPFLHEDSIVCTLQNGIPEDYVASIVGKERTIGGAVGFGATWIGPGESELATSLDAFKQHAFDIGEMNGENTDRIVKVKEILDAVGECKITSNILGLKWSKLLMNATFSGMSAALGCAFGDVLDHPLAMKSLANIADETIKVAHANGIRLEQIQGRDMTFLELENQEDIESKMPFYNEVWDVHRKTKASMLQDIEKRIPSEIDYINGYVIKAGKKYGISTPFNDLVYQLVNNAESKGYAPEFMGNIGYFKSLLNDFGHKV